MRARLVPSIALFALSFGACERDALIGRDIAVTVPDASAGGTNTGGAATGGREAADSTPAACVPVSCEGQTYACGDCKDNDGDGTVDMDDVDCLGPCHDAEDNFASPSHGKGPACDLDCYFDGNNGAGNDGCGWSHRCDPLSVAPYYPPEGDHCAYDEGTKVPRYGSCAEALTAQTQSCIDTCLPLTPNGCDCFGCCAVPGAPAPGTIWLGSASEDGIACDLAHVGDATVCKPCTQVPSCLNRCDECERCVGKSVLPASCSAGGECPTPRCDRGAPCGSSCLGPCPDGEACITGCCAVIPR